MKALNRTITILRKRLDDMLLPEEKKQALIVAAELETLREAKLIIDDNAHVNVPKGLDDWDCSLVILASNTHYDYHRDIRNLILTAHSYEAQHAIKTIADILRDKWRNNGD